MVDAPVNVRLRYDDGRIIPLELTYEGTLEGIHVWMAVIVCDLVGHSFDLMADELPAKTTICLPFHIPEGDGDEDP